MKLVVEKEVKYLVRDDSRKKKLLYLIEKIKMKYDKGEITREKMNSLYIYLNTFFEFHSLPTSCEVEDLIKYIEKNM